MSTMELDAYVRGCETGWHVETYTSTIDRDDFHDDFLVEATLVHLDGRRVMVGGPSMALKEAVDGVVLGRVLPSSEAMREMQAKIEAAFRRRFLMSST